MLTALKVRSKACQPLTLAIIFIRIGQKNPKYPDFKNKTADEALWLDSAPHYVLEKLDGLTFNSGYNAAKTYKPFNSSMGKGKTLNIRFSLFVLIFDTNIQYKQQVRIQVGVNSRQAKLPLLRNKKRKVAIIFFYFLCVHFTLPSIVKWLVEYIFFISTRHLSFCTW